jgi:CRISP-associated protein Cas1
MPELYAATPGALVRMHEGRIRVDHGSKILGEAPLETVDAAFLLAGVSITRGAQDALTARGAPVVFVTQAEGAVSAVSAASGRHLQGRVGQARAFADPGMRLAYASALCRHKACAQWAVLESYSRRGWLKKMPARTKRGDPRDSQQLMGWEGFDTSAYFSAWRSLTPPEWASERRSRHPPEDPLNALLSLGYTLASARILAAVTSEGLDPWLGMHHSPHHRMQALVQDLVEPFRSCLVDAWALRLIRTNLVSPDDFEETDRGPMLHRTPALRRVVSSFVQALGRPVVGWRFGAHSEARRTIHVWTSAFREAFSCSDPSRLA